MTIRTLLLAWALFLVPQTSFGFCGFYVAKADTSLWNKASKVAIVRHENRTVLSMMNDYQGDPKDFAMVVPVPTVLEEGQINVGEKVLFERLDAFTAPRLVEYFDPDPCEIRPMHMESRMMRKSAAPEGAIGQSGGDKSLGVTIEASYSVGEYDILILSAKESEGLETWLTQNGYKLPKGASKALAPYIKMDMKFFVAKVDLKKQSKTGLSYLRPLQIAFESEKFMLPIRLGTLNAQGKQDIVAYMLTKSGRVETTNYRTVNLPTNLEIPIFVKDDFGTFYKDMFEHHAKKEDYRVVFTEYFWNMGWCDPCAADPLTPQELKKLGVFWVQAPSKPIQTKALTTRPGAIPPNFTGPVPVMVTRLHVRYDAKTFPEDLFFQETQDKQNFQARYVLRHPYKGDPNECEASINYFSTTLPDRQKRESENLARLTGWDINEIREKADYGELPTPKKWWEIIWN